MQNIPNHLPNGLDRIKRVVVLMFENRSFDHLFGAFPGVRGLFTEGQLNQDYFNLPNPLLPPSPSNTPVYPTPIDPDIPQAHDFTHDFGDGMMPDLFGPVFTVTGDPAIPSNPQAVFTSGYAKGQLIGATSVPPPLTYPTTNSGFYTTYNSCNQQGQAAMTYFENGSLKVLHKLASEFVLCDNWHCDMPGHTLPNRAFIHCGTTNAVSIDDTDGGMVNATSIFDVIDSCNPGANVDWKMYAPVDDCNNLGQLDTRFLNEGLSNYQGFPLTEFAKDCKNGTLPFYSFIMCWLPGADAWTDTSMHPNALMQPGENLLAAVYNTLRKSPCWEDTLLVVTFDENGGIYDHVFPPSAKPPICGAQPLTQNTQGCCGNQWILNSTFDFSLLGLRVPAILVSPWLSKGIDSTQYQNTSVLRFLIDKLNAAYNANVGYLTQRDATAPQLNCAFSQFGVKTMREDCPMWMEPYATLPTTDPNTQSNAIPFASGTLSPWSPPLNMNAAPPVPYINELLNIYLNSMPGHPDSGKNITRAFVDNNSVNEYIEERLQAAGQKASGNS
jgi:phospholipase C